MYNYLPSYVGRYYLSCVILGENVFASVFRKISVNIISLTLSSWKADSRRHSERFRYILSLLRYFRVRRTCVGIPQNYPFNMFFHCLQLFVIKKCAVLKFFRKNIVYLQILSSYIEVFIFNLYNKIFYEYYT